ncbi:MAG: cation diffusion facilitator family transporter [Rhodospirillales bacterium]
MFEGTPPSAQAADAELQANSRLLRLATYAAVSVASLLIVIKFIAWVMTDSVSLLSTLIDSLLDVGASLINLVAVHHALQPPDREHRFGHGKAEPLAGIVQAAFISGSALFLLIQAGERLVRPRAIGNADVGIVVMVFGIALTAVLVLFQRFVIRKTNSVAIKGDSIHYQMDILVNGGVLLSLFLASRFDWLYADPIFAIGIAAYIFWGAWQIGKLALHLLMDHELPQEDRDRIRSIAMAHPGVRALHDLRTRSSGQQAFIQFHMEMDGDMTLFDAHVISDQVEAEIMRAFPNAEVIIHEDPEGIEEQHPDMAYRRFSSDSKNDTT